MIRARDLHFGYGGRDVLRGVSFEIADGGLTALLGCNGAGKTTLFRCLLGLQGGYTGGIEIDGEEIRGFSAARLARRVAYIPQTHYPAFNYSALDMVLMGTTQQLGAFSSPGETQRRLAREAMERMGVEALADRGFTRLSGGERQLVLIARALAQQAKILLMDEPTSSLDFGNQTRVMEQARALSQSGYTVLMSTHNPQHALTYADRVLALSDGRLLRDGAPRDVMDEALMETLYGVQIAFYDTPGGCILVARGDKTAPASAIDPR